MERPQYLRAEGQAFRHSGKLAPAGLPVWGQEAFKWRKDNFEIDEDRSCEVALIPYFPHLYPPCFLQISIRNYYIAEGNDRDDSAGL